jgi:uncharacterized membrane protein
MYNYLIMKLFLIPLCLCILVLTGCSSTPNTVVTEPETNEATAQDNEILEDEAGQLEIEAVVDEAGVPNDDTAGVYDLNTIQISSNGTEPFWNFTASGSTLLLREATQTGPMSTTPYTVTMSQTSTTVTLTNPNITAVLTLQTCSDGMSDIVYTHESVVTK